MKTTHALAFLAVLSVGAAQAQEPSAPPTPAPAPAPTPSPAKRPPTAMHVQIVVSRTQAGKLVSRLPYTMTCILDAERPATLRMGVEVPISMGGDKGVQYRNVGINIDCSCYSMRDDDRFRLKIALEQSSISDLGRGGLKSGAGADATGGEAVEAGNPMFRTFHSNFSAILRDRQGPQSTAAATDPVTGEDVTIEATLRVLK